MVGKMRLFEILAPIYEAVDSSNLYHITKGSRIAAILHDDCLKVNKPVEFGKSRVGISLTRDPVAPLIVGNVILVLDQQKLRQNFRLEPRYGDSRHAAAIATANPKDYAPVEPRREAEEFCTKDIKPLSRYLKALVISKYLIDNFVYKEKFGRKFEQETINAKIVLQWISDHNIPLIQPDEIENVSSWISKV